MELVRPFAKLGRNDAPLAGGKGASLGEMTSAGIPVPPGFVVLADTFEKFLEETDLLAEIDSILHKVNHQEIHTVEAAAEQIKGLILAAKMPADIAKEIERGFKVLGAEYVAVRSSATAEDGAEHAWAGQLESYLNVTKDGVLEKVQHCWASLFTPRAIFYRFEKGLHGTKISVAVVVQKMVASEISGIAFSVHPVTEDYNQLIIEAGFGLGEAIVSGQITPDSYVVEKNPRNILDVNVSTQTRGLYKKAGGGNEWLDIAEPKASSQVLTTEQILELSALILKIENHYGFPCDIEWAFAAGKFYIVQSRPITTLANKNVPPTHEEGGEKSLEFEKSITRDWGIVYAEIWHRVFTEEFKKQIGWGYTDVVFEGKDNTISIYRAPAEHLDGMRSYITTKLDNDPGWLDNQAKQITKQVKDTGTWVEKIKSKNLNTYSDQELADIFEKLIEQNVALGPAFIMMLWFPIQMENHSEANKHQPAIDIAIKTRHDIEKIGPLIDSFAREIGIEVAKRARLDKALSKFISSEEILNYFKSKTEINENILRDRQRYFLVTNKGILNTPLETYLSTEGYRLKKIALGEVGEIKGNIAYPGKVTGRVKIVRNKNEFGKVELGDILVTGMTTPDFLPVIQKSAAFVTDEGGITCHASIVSREMKKPCIIGTKFATQALKDGDEVEVDADNGMVRILNKNIEYLSPENLTRLFSWSGFIPHLYSDRFVQSYIDINGIAMCSPEIWLSYMSKQAEEGTRAEGVALYCDANCYEKLKKDHQTTYDQTKQFMDNILKSPKAQKKDVEGFLESANAYGKNYRCTEFFYTDLAFKQQLKQSQIAESFKTFEQFKLDGRKKLNDMFFVPDAFFAQVVNKLSADFKLPADDLLQYSMAELLDLFNSKQVAGDVIAERKKGYVIYAKDGLTHSLIGDDALKVVGQFHRVDYQQKELKGTVASPGKATGSAKVFKIEIKAYDKLGSIVDAMLPGQILVAETTEPSIIMACNKAGAIITNQGGMMSHAAIVSRELKIPCLVGVVNATEIIQEGDKLEVDADKGIVRILEK